MEKSYNIPAFNLEKFYKEIDGTVKDKIYASTYKAGVLTVFLKDPVTAQEELDLDGYVSNHDGTPSVRLRIFRVLPDNLDPLISDFSILGFRKETPSYSRGRKTKAIYKCVNSEDVIVQKTFTDLVQPDNTIHVQVQFDWFDEDNNIALTKTEVVAKYNKYKTETVLRERRYRQFDFLKAAARGTPNEPYIDILMNHYHDEISDYKEDGKMKLDSDMDNETDTLILGILNASVPREDGEGMTTVIKAIKYQIGTIELSEL